MKKTTTATTTSTTASPISNDIIPTKITEVVQNKLPWQPMFAPTSPSSEVQTVAATESKPDVRLPAESNISVQNSARPTATDKPNSIENQTEQSWVPVTEVEESTELVNATDKMTIPPVDATRSTGFESITKLPADITTPQDESVASSDVNQTVTEEKPNTTTDYEITTIRFSYVPTEDVETETSTIDSTTPSMWHPVFPTRTRITTLKDSPITTYRPKYMTTETIEETTTIITESTSPIEVSSQILETTTEELPVTTEIQTTEIPTEPPTTTELPTQPPTEEITTELTTEVITTQQPTTETLIVETTQATTTEVPATTSTSSDTEDTTTIVVEVVTEINTEREQIITSTTEVNPKTTETSSESQETDCTEENSQSNEVITQETFRPTTTEGVTTEAETIKPTTVVVITKKEEVLTYAPPTTTVSHETITQQNAKIHDTTVVEMTTDTDHTTKSVSEIEDLTSYAGDMTTEASSRVLGDEDNSSGAAVAIAVSTIGVIALILLIGLLVSQIDSNTNELHG